MVSVRDSVKCAWIFPVINGVCDIARCDMCQIPEDLHSDDYFLM